MQKPFSTVHVLTGIGMAAMLLVGCQDFMGQKEESRTPAETSESAREAEAAKEAEDADKLKAVASAAVDAAVCDSLLQELKAFSVKDVQTYDSLWDAQRNALNQNYAKLCPLPPPVPPADFSFCGHVLEKMANPYLTGPEMDNLRMMFSDSCVGYNLKPAQVLPETTKTDYPRDLPLQAAYASMCDSLLQELKAFSVKDGRPYDSLWDAHRNDLNLNYAKLCPSPPPAPPADYSLCGDLVDKMSSPDHSESKLATYRQMYADSCAGYKPAPAPVLPETTTTDPHALPAPARDSVLCAEILALIHAAVVKDGAYMALQERFRAEGCYTPPVTLPPVPVEVICKELHAKLSGLVSGTPEHAAYLKDFNHQCGGLYPAPEPAPIALPAPAKDTALCADIMAQIQASTIKDDAYIALWNRYNAEGCSPPPAPVTTRYEEATCRKMESKMAVLVPGTPEHASYTKDFNTFCGWMSPAK